MPVRWIIHANTNPSSACCTTDCLQIHISLSLSHYVYFLIIIDSPLGSTSKRKKVTFRSETYSAHEGQFAARLMVEHLRRDRVRQKKKICLDD